MTDSKSTIEIGWNLENSYSNLPESFFTRLKPVPVKSPKLILLNQELAESIGLNGELLESDYGAEVFAGNRLPDGSIPIAQAYSGHQFGYFTMLGDGRAVLLGEQITPKGDRLDIQLKGSGRTPYSRGGDGRATLGPMLREYVVSEAMHSLGIPTTRSLAVATTGESVIREKELPGAILARVSSSHIRVGTFEYASRFRNTEELRALADYTIERHFPNAESGENPYISLLSQVMARQAELVASWQCAGFVHGVMNTDNMAISGETIDYGPCAFMDSYDPDTVFSSIDTYGRYAYGNQPKMASWNLARFAETLIPIIHDSREEAIRLSQNAVLKFGSLYNAEWLRGMRAKLGIFGEEPEDEAIIKELLTTMYQYKADYTNTFRDLTLGRLKDTQLYGTEEFSKWNEVWQKRLERQKESRESSHNLMKNSNPAIIPRNHCVEDALEAAVEGKDYSFMEDLVVVLSDPYNYSVKRSDYYTTPRILDSPYRTFCGT